MKKDLTKCKELHATASQSNTELHKAMQTHMENIKLLASPVETLQATLPSAKGARSKSFIYPESPMDGWKNIPLKQVRYTRYKIDIIFTLFPISDVFKL